jgi:hypothetical protein
MIWLYTIWGKTGLVEKFQNPGFVSCFSPISCGSVEE